MYHKGAMADVQCCEQHLHVGLDVGEGEDEGLVADDGLQVALHEVKDQCQILLKREHVEEGDDVGAREARELPQQLHLAEGRDVHPLLGVTNPDLLDGDTFPTLFREMKVVREEGMRVNSALPPPSRSP